MHIWFLIDQCWHSEKGTVHLFLKLLSAFITFHTLSAATSAKSYSFFEFSSFSVVFFTVSAAVTLMMQDCTADRSLQFLMKWLLSSQCMHSYFIQCFITFFSDTYCALHLSSVSVAVTMMCSVSSQFMLFVWDCCVMMIVFIQHSWVTVFWIEFKL